MKIVNLTVKGNGTTGPYFLGDYHILMESETISKNGLLLQRDTNYELNYNQGILRLNGVLNESDSLRISYARLCLRLEKSYYHRQITYAQGETQQSTVTTRVEQKGMVDQRGIAPDFRIDGNKVFSLEVGSQRDFSLKQALRVSLSGHITKDMQINALLSDQSSSSTTPGTTKRLEELDKVLIELRSSHFTGTLGDYYLNYQGNRLSNYDKKLKGIMLEGNAKNISGSFALASSKGEYFSNRFQGIEGKQGPYKLKGKQGQIDISVLAGTEKVWVDGDLTVRGSDNDYVIDYTLATIHFTSKRLITGDSRISVDFEYSVESYQRGFYAARLGFTLLQGKIDLRTLTVVETDNKDDPLSTSLSSEDRDVLSEAGDDPFKATKDGAVFTDIGKGGYQINLDSLGNQYYQYVGVDSGSYNVSFSWVGEGKGDYIYQGRGIYKYVYSDNGQYLPILFLPLPSKHAVLDLAVVMQPLVPMRVEMEYAKSQRDLNTFSKKDDQDNWGDALDFKCTFGKEDFSFLNRDFSRLQLGGSFRYLTREYSPIGRIDQVEKDREWNLPSVMVNTDQKEQHYFGTVQSSRDLDMRIEYGKLDLPGLFGSQRKSINLNLLALKRIETITRWENIESWQQDDTSIINGDLLRNMFGLTGNLNKFSSAFNWQREKRTAQSTLISNGDQFNQYRLGLASFGWRNLAVSTEYTYRQDNRLQEVWLKEAVSHIWQNRLAVKDWARSASLNLEYTHRMKSFKEIAGTSNREDLANARMNIYPANQLLNLELYFSVNRTQSTEKIRNYVDVGEGNGEYVFQDGQYVPDANGNYIIVTESVGDAQFLTDLRKNVRLLFSPYKSLMNKKGYSWEQTFVRQFYTDTFISMNHQTRGRVSWFKYFGFPWSFSAGDVLFESSLLRQDVYLFPQSRKLTARLRLENERQLDNLFTYEEQTKRKSKTEVLIKSRLTEQYSLEFELGKENQEDRSLNGIYRIRAYYIANRANYFPAKYVELVFSSRFREEREKINLLKVDILTLSPGMTWFLAQKGSAKGNLALSRIWFSPQDRKMPYQMSLGKRAGTNLEWSLSFEYKLNEYVASDVIYQGKSEPYMKTQHFVRAEVRASF